MGKVKPQRLPLSPTHSRSSLLKRKLQQSHERYTLVAKATNDVIYDLNLKKATVVWNDVLFSKYGYDRLEPAGTLEWWVGHIHPDDAARIENEISELMLGDCHTWQIQYRFRKADGEYAVVRDRAYVQRDHDGQPLRIIGSMLDITEAEQLDRAKDEFTSLVSHQLRTPLTVIQLYTAMLSDGTLGPLAPQQLEHVQRINQAGVRLIKLVSNILNISRLELDRTQPTEALTDLQTLVSATIGSLQPLAQENGVAVSFRRHRAVSAVRVDRELFGEVVQNLLGNAIHYSAANGHGKVIVSIKRESANVLLSVQDNGIGIPEAAQSHIFKRFYRADNAVQAGVEGTGLGLYLARLIVQSCGGSISFSSLPGRGTTFFVRLPAAE